MYTEKQIDEAIQKTMATFECKPEYRMMYRWIGVCRERSSLFFYVGDRLNDPGDNNLTVPYTPCPEIKTDQDWYDHRNHLYKRVLAWQWNGKWELVDEDCLKALW